MKGKNDFDSIEKISINRTLKRSVKINRLRNIFIITAVALITFMSSTIFDLAVSYNKNYSIMVNRKTGTCASIKLKNFKAETLSEISALDYVKYIGVENVFGEIIKKEKKDFEINLKYIDDTEYKKHKKPAIIKTSGFFPRRKNEIAISRAAISALKLGKIKTGDYITLDIKSHDNRIRKETFRVSMIYTDYVNYTRQSDILVSEKYYFLNAESSISNANISFKESTKRSELSDNLINEINLSADEHFEKLINTHIDIKSAKYYALILGCISVFLILIFGTVVLYNMFDIYVKQDILFFSKLKLAGASSAQINLLVRKTALRLAVYAIPIGIVASVFFSFIFVPLAMKLLNEVYIIDSAGLAYHLSFNPLPVIVSSALTFLCVMASAVIPANKAARFSVSKGMDINNKNKLRFFNDNIYKTALENIFSDKLNFIYVIIPAAFGVVSFLIINTSVDIRRIANMIFSSKLLFFDQIDFLNSNMLMFIIKLLLLGLSILVYIIGIMNFINETLSNYNNKYYIYKTLRDERERQKLRKTSVFEGVYYSLFINIISAIFICLYIIIIGKFNIFYLFLSLLMMLVISAVCTAVPAIMYEMFVKRAKKR